MLVFHCPTGQIEGVNAIIYSLLSTGAEQTNLEHRLKRMLALKKLEWFPRAVLTKGGADNRQNTHLISYYRRLLKERMNLTSTVQSYRERLGVMGHDPFNGNPWNVMKIFYYIVTPDRMAGWVLAHTENQNSLDLRAHQADLEAALCAASPKTLGKDRATRLGTKNINPIDKRALQTALKRVKAQIEQDRMHRFFRVGDMVAYLYDKGRIPIAKAEGAACAASAVASPWWEGLFTTDPSDPYPEIPALLTHKGAVKILELIGMVVLTPSKEEGIR